MIDVITPPATIGFVGGGQLGRMMAVEARRLGYRTVVLDPEADGPAAQVCDEQVVADIGDHGAATEFARRCDVVTLEWENAPVSTVRAIEQIVPVRPGSTILAVAQNRLREKATARSLGLETAPFLRVTSVSDLTAAIEEVGLPLILKTTTGGYDGKGQGRAETEEQARALFSELHGGTRELIAEGVIDFEREISVIVVRAANGSMTTFPIGENEHRNGVLDVTAVPAGITAQVEERARAAATRLATGVELVGILAVEMFVTRDGHVLINEVAPRPHNSGHYSADGCTTSQFEQNIRAICGLPLHEPLLLSPCAMANLLGPGDGGSLPLDRIGEALRTPDVRLHLYGKSESRPGRKMGHLTAFADSPVAARRRALEARSAFFGS